MGKKSAKNAANSDLDFLDDLGSSMDSFDVAGNSPDDVIDNIVGSFIERVKDNINSLDLNSTGKMQNIFMVRNGDIIEVHAPEYLIYQDRGVSGTEQKHPTPFTYRDKMPPPDVFKAWIKQKNLTLRHSEKMKGKKSKFQEVKDVDSLSWVMAKTVQKKGIKPKNFFTKEIPQLERELSEHIPNIIIKNAFDNLNKK